MTHQPPEHLDDVARAKWAELLPILDGRGTLDAGDLDALSCYVSAWSQWVTAQAQVHTLGLLTKSPAGFPQENPFLTIGRRAQAELRRWGDVLKIHPKSKARTKPKDEDDQAGDFLATLMQTRRSGN